MFYWWAVYVLYTGLEISSVLLFLLLLPWFAHVYSPLCSWLACQLAWLVASVVVCIII